MDIIALVVVFAFGVLIGGFAVELNHSNNKVKEESCGDFIIDLRDETTDIYRFDFNCPPHMLAEQKAVSFDVVVYK